MSIASSPDFFLTRLGDELVLQEGQPPQADPNVPRKRILIVGVTAWAFLDAGYDVTVIAERWADPKNRITSQIAGALWEFPPAVCGKHTDVISLHNSKRWCMTAYRVFDKLQAIMPRSDYLDHGVQMRMANFFFDQKMENMPDRGQLDKYEEIVAQNVFPKVTEALAVTHDDKTKTLYSSFPRNDNNAHPLAWPNHKIRTRPHAGQSGNQYACNTFAPGLEHAEYDPDAPLVQGFPPIPGLNVRVSVRGFSLGYGRCLELSLLSRELDDGSPCYGET
ncbi:hypothetical protein CPB85DRAFT_1457784 [Mucidula mucida]|nr:hypothetical protein CPB85DRAFT_1457784 [Mucidula mucida]